MVVPGWGQLATGHRVKAVIIAAGAAGLGVRIALTSRDANNATREANQATTEGEYDHWVAVRDSHLNARDSAVTYLILLWCYNMIDAYVDGQFVGFEGLELRIADAGRVAPGSLPLASLAFHW